jgi:hypothetical protein
MLVTMAACSVPRSIGAGIRAVGLKRLSMGKGILS